jgi:plasmid stabilization system protein ParE
VTPPYILSADAKDDLKEIWSYTANKGTAEAADKVVDRIFSECEKLGETPGLGHFRDDLLDRRHKFWSVWS